MYYLRTRPAANAIQFTVDQTLLQQTNKENKDSIDTDKQKKLQREQQAQAALECSLTNREACLMCSS